MVNPVMVNQLEPPAFLTGADEVSLAAAALMALLEKRRRPAVLVDVKAARRAAADDEARIVESMVFVD